MELANCQPGQALVLGKKTSSYVSKKTGEEITGTNLYLCRPFNDSETAGALDCQGLLVEEEWTKLNCADIHPGDICYLAYGKGFQGRAQLIAIQPVK